MASLPEPPHRHGAEATARGRAAVQPRHARRADARRRAPLPGASSSATPASSRSPAAVAPILHGIILRVRPGQVGRQVRHRLDAGGLAAQGLDREAGHAAARLAGRARAPRSRCAMPCATASPSIAVQLDALKARRRDAACWCCRPTRNIRAPPRPASSTPSTPGRDARATARAALRQPLPRRPGYIAALARRCASTGSATAAADKLVMSFHGVPERTLHLGDPYHCECHKTAACWPRRCGCEPAWLRHLPVALRQGQVAGALHRADAGRAGPGGVESRRRDLPRLHRRLPGDAGGDRQEARDAFLAAGGSSFHYIPCLNDHPAGMRALANWRSATCRAGRPKRPTRTRSRCSASGRWRLAPRISRGAGAPCRPAPPIRPAPSSRRLAQARRQR